MNTFDGYIRRDGTNSKVLLDGGDAKALSSFIGTLSYNDNKITYTKADGSTSYDLVDLSNYIYSLVAATSDNLGGIRIGFPQSGKDYPVKLDSNNKAYVYVPWEANTHYTTKLYVGDGTAENKITINGNTRIAITDDNTVRNYITLIGSGATTVSSDDNGKITINSTNTTYDTGDSATLNTGTNTEGKLWSAKTLVDYISDILGVDSTAITSLNTLVNQLHDSDTATGILVELAKKLNTPSSSIGNNKQPIYWNGSSFATIGYTIETSVPSGAVFTDTKYSFYVGENNNTKEHKNVNNPYFKLFENNTPTSIQIKAGTGISVVSDVNGNITIKNEAPDLNHDTHYTTGLYVGATEAKSNALTTNGNTYIKLFDDDSRRSNFKISGTQNVSVSSDANGNVTIIGPDLSGLAVSGSLDNYLPLSGGTMTGSIIMNQGTSTRNVGIVGTYDYTKAAAIWAMGSSYQIPAAGNNLGSLYGAAYVYENLAGQGTMAGGHQFVWAANGVVKVALGNSGVWTTGGFYKNDSSNDYVLLGGGGHKALSDFASSSNTMTFHISNNYLAADLPKDMAIKAFNTYIEFWDEYEGAGWYNFRLGQLRAVSGVQVLSNNSWIDVALVGHTHNDLYVTSVGLGSGDYANNLYYTKNGNNSYFTVNYASNSNITNTFNYIDDWNIPYGSNKVNFISCHANAASGAPGGYYSGVSFMTDYVGFLLVTYAGSTENLLFRRVQDNGTWNNWRTIYHTGNLPAYPTKASWNYDDMYVSSVSISENNLRINKNGSNTDLTIPYSTTSETSDATYFLYTRLSALESAGVQFIQGQIRIGSSDNLAYSGSSSNFKVLSFPPGGTWTSNEYANVAVFRISCWGTTYWHDLHFSPNDNRIYHRVVFNSSPIDWRTVVETTGNKGNSTKPVYVSGGLIYECDTYPTKASWNYDDRYVKLSGDNTITGILTISPTNVSSYLDALVLHDPGVGRSEGAKIRFTSSSYTTGITLYPNSDKSALLIDGNTILTSANISSYALTDSTKFQLNDIQEGAVNHFGQEFTIYQPNTVTKMPDIHGYKATGSARRICGLGFNGYTIWTVSGYFKADSAITVNIDLCDVNSNTSYGENSTSVQLTTEYVYHKFTYTSVTSYNTSSAYNGFLDIEGSSNVMVYAKDLMIEEGYVAHAWRPSITEFLTGTYSTGTWDISITGNATTATKATNDSDGNAINTTYLKKSGGTVTGPITINSSVNGSYNEGLRITRAGNSWAGITFGSTGTSGAPTGGWFVATNPSNQFIINPDDSGSTAGLCLNKGGDLKWRNQTVIHSGNIGSQSVSYASSAGSATVLSSEITNDKLPYRLRTNTGGSGYVSNPNNFMTSGFGYSSSNGPGGSGDCNIIGVHHTLNGWGHQLAFKFNQTGTTGNSYDGKDVWTRIYHLSNAAWSPWYSLLTSGNVGFNYSDDIRYEPHTKKFICTRSSLGWSSHAYSTEGYSTNVEISFKPGLTNKYIMVGLNSDPATDASYNSIDYCWYVRTDGKVVIYENGSSTGTFVTYSIGDEFSINYTGYEVKYYKNDELIRIVKRGINGKLYFDSSFYNDGFIYDVRFENKQKYYIEKAYNNPWNDKVIPLNLEDGHHMIHLANVEHSSILSGRDYNGSYWQLYFHPTNGYTQDIKYRATNCTSWKVLIDSNNYTNYCATANHNHDSIYLKKGGDSMTGDFGIKTEADVDWNITRGESKIRYFTCKGTKAANAPCIYASGVSFMTSYCGFLLGVYGGTGTTTLYYRHCGDSGTNWSNWYTIIHSGGGNLSINGTFTATAFYASSDLRLKNILTHPNYSAEQLASLPLVKYTWKDKENDSVHLGSIAQNAEEDFAELVNTDDKGYKSLDYATLGAIGVISLAREIVELRKEIKELKSKLYG